MNWRLGFIIAALAVALIVLFWRPFSSPEPAEGVLDPTELQPDFVAEGLFTKLFNPAGELQHRIESIRMAHFSAIGLTELTEPRYITTIVDDEGNSQVWQLTADKGTYHNDERLELNDNVRITNIEGNAFIEALETEYLLIYLNTQEITTDRPVLVYGPQFQIRGQGLRANLEAQQLELINHVQTTYYPQRAAD